MIPNLYMENGCITKHPIKNGCLGIQVIFKTLKLMRTSRLVHARGVDEPKSGRSISSQLELRKFHVLNP